MSEASPIIQALRELEDELDNRRRINILNALPNAYEAKELKLVAFGPMACQVESFELGNGHVYRPWPARQPPNGEQYSPALMSQFQEFRYQYHADVAIGELVKQLSPGQLVLALDETVTEDMALIALSVGSALACYPVSGEYPEAEEYSPPQGRTPQRTGMGTIMTAEAAEHLHRISQEYFSLPQEQRSVLLGAMEWIRLGLLADALMVRFVCNWIAIEKMAQWWTTHEGLRKDDAAILRELGTINNVEVQDDGIFIRKTGEWARVFGRLRALGQHLDMTAKEQIEAAFDHVLDVGDARRLKANLFTGDPSAKDLRNQVAHGEVDEATVSGRSRIEGLALLTEMGARTFLLKSIEQLASDAPRTPIPS